MVAEIMKHMVMVMEAEDQLTLEQEIPLHLLFGMNLIV